MTEEAGLATVLMTEHEARAATEAIRNAVENVAQMIADAHDREAWRALGYKGWAAYIDAEFPFSRRRSYQLVDQGRAMRMLAAEIGRPVEVSSRQAKQLVKNPTSVKRVAHFVESGVSPAEAVEQATRSLPVTRSAFEDGYGHTDDLPERSVDEEVACAHEFVCRYCGEPPPP